MSKLASADLQSQQWLILQAAEVAHAAYSPTPFGHTFGFSGVSTFEAGNASGFIGYDPDGQRVWVGFAGTQDRNDWKDDFAYQHAKFAGSPDKGRVHRGFARQYAAVSDLFLEQMNAIPRIPWDIAPVIFTGHSLGGALAQIAAVKMQAIGYDTSAIVFGSPRVFCPVAAYYANHVSRANITRVEALTDWVCDVPTQGGRFPYAHAGSALFIDSRGEVTTENRPWVWRFVLWLKRVLRCRFAWDVHSMYEYKRRLRKWKERCERRSS